MDYEHVKKQLGYGIQTESKDNAIKALEQLQAKVAELEEENARLKAAVEYAETIRVENIAYFEKQLATSQLRETQLREALEKLATIANQYAGHYPYQVATVVDAALSAPADTSALDAYVAEKVKEIESCRDWYKRRIDLLQEWQSKMRDPERTIVCDIIANGLTMPEGGRYEIGKSDLSTITRQRDLAVEALKKAVDMVGHPDNIELLQNAIKESDGK